LDEYRKQQEEKKTKLNLPAKRNAGEGVDPSAWKDFVPLSREGEEAQQPSVQKEKKQKEGTKQVPLNQIFNVKIPSNDLPKRTGGGRGSPRPRDGAQNKGPKVTKQQQQRANAPNVKDETSFPALSTKA